MQKLIKPPKLSAQIGLNRRSEKRADAAFIAAARANGRAKFLTFFDLKVPIIPSQDRATAQIRWLALPDVKAVAEPNEFVFLGEEETALIGAVGTVRPHRERGRGLQGKPRRDCTSAQAVSVSSA